VFVERLEREEEEEMERNGREIVQEGSLGGFICVKTLTRREQGARLRHLNGPLEQERVGVVLVSLVLERERVMERRRQWGDAKRGARSAFLLLLLQWEELQSELTIQHVRVLAY